MTVSVARLVLQQPYSRAAEIGPPCTRDRSASPLAPSRPRLPSGARRTPLDVGDQGRFRRRLAPPVRPSLPSSSEPGDPVSHHGQAQPSAECLFHLCSHSPQSESAEASGRTGANFFEGRARISPPLWRGADNRRTTFGVGVGVGRPHARRHATARIADGALLVDRSTPKTP